jgi:hypothetical protein
MELTVIGKRDTGKEKGRPEKACPLRVFRGSFPYSSL